MAHAPEGGNAPPVHLFVAGCRHNLRHAEAGWVTRVTFTVSSGWHRWTAVAELLRPDPFEYKKVHVVIPARAPQFVDPTKLAAALRDYLATVIEGAFWKTNPPSGTLVEGVTYASRWEATFRPTPEGWQFEKARTLPSESELPQGPARLVAIPRDPERLACSKCVARLEGNPLSTYAFEFADQRLGDEQFQIYGGPGELRRRAVAGPNFPHVLGVAPEATLLCVSCRESATPGYRWDQPLDAVHEPHRAFSARTGEDVEVPSDHVPAPRRESPC